MKEIFFLLVLIAIGQTLSSRPNLVPYPNEIRFGNESLSFDPCHLSFQFHSVFLKLGDIPSYFNEILDFYFKTTFPQSICPATIDHKATRQRKSENFLTVNIQNVEFLAPELLSRFTNESYSLHLDSEWLLEADNYHGFLRGLETFFQLLEPLANPNQYRLNFLPIHIKDTPSLGYRGLMLDTARHYLQMTTLKHVLDGMMFHKLNVFHWHITDDESFPLVLESLPELSQYGAFSIKHIYTREDVTEIVRYARLRGIRVIAEIDSPGHCLSWGFSPELADIVLNCPVWANYQGQLDPTLNKTYDTVEKILNDLTSYFPDEFVHLGGDEVSYSCWENKPWIKTFMNEHNISTGLGLQNYYKNREKTLLNKEKSAIFWVKDSNFDYEANDVMQYWGASTQYDLIKNYSNPVILSPYDYLYIDVGYGNAFGDSSWAPFITWKTIYHFNPFPAEIEKSRILGAEVTLWAEVNSDSTTDNHIWSRASAFAERMWNAEINDGDRDIVGRLYANEQRLIRRGFYPSPVTTQYCAGHLDVCFAK